MLRLIMPSASLMRDFINKSSAAIPIGFDSLPTRPWEGFSTGGDDLPHGIGEEPRHQKSLLYPLWHLRNLRFEALRGHRVRA